MTPASVSANAADRGVLFADLAALRDLAGRVDVAVRLLDGAALPSGAGWLGRPRLEAALDGYLAARRHTSNERSRVVAVYELTDAAVEPRV